MMTPIIFDVQGADIRFGVTDDGTPYAVASDFAKTMGYRDASDATRLLDEDEKGTQIVRTPGGPQQMNVIFEDGIWELVFRSSLPGAKAIKARVKAILKQIRETGRYEVEPVAPAAPALPQDYEEALVALLGQVRENKALESKVAELEPAAESWNTLATAHGDFSVRDAAKILSRDPNIQTGERRLFTWLLDERWVYRQQLDGRYRAMQMPIDLGRMSELPSSHYHPRTGELVLDAPQVRITIKGLGVLHKRLGGTGQLQIGAGS